MGNPEYKIHMLLTVRHLEEEDFGTYRCVAKNPRGETDGSIKVYNSGPPPTTTEVPSAKENVDEKQRFIDGNCRNKYPRYYFLYMLDMSFHIS
ncbi:hypothetical protein Anas_06305, partial [Armadillidium nasatum]